MCVQVCSRAVTQTCVQVHSRACHTDVCTGVLQGCHTGSAISQGALAQEKESGQGLVEQGGEQGQGWLRERVLVKGQREELGSAKQWGWG